MYIAWQIVMSFLQFGGDEYFEKGACLIEWGEIIEDALPKKHIKITFSRDFETENRRVVQIEGEKYEDIID